MCGFFNTLLRRVGGLGLRQFLQGGGLRLLCIRLLQAGGFLLLARFLRVPLPRLPEVSARSIRRVVMEVSADPTMEAAADFSRESGALSQEDKAKETQKESTRKK